MGETEHEKQETAVTNEDLSALNKHLETADEKRQLVLNSDGEVDSNDHNVNANIKAHKDAMAKAVKLYDEILDKIRMHPKGLPKLIITKRQFSRKYNPRLRICQGQVVKYKNQFFVQLDKTKRIPKNYARSHITTRLIKGNFETKDWKVQKRPTIAWGSELHVIDLEKEYAIAKALRNSTGE